MKKYYSHTLKKAVTVKSLVTLEYLTLSPSFRYPEECHDFYELAYVDGGVLTCNVDGAPVTLYQNDLLVITPHSKHYYQMQTESEASVFIVCFSSKSVILEMLAGIGTLNKTEKALVLKILEEAKKAFRFPYEKKLVPLPSAAFGAQQMIENVIEELLIQLIRKRLDEDSGIKIVNNAAELKSNLVEDVRVLLKEHLYRKLTLDTISKKTFYSKTYLNNVFKKQFGSSIIHYYIAMKIEESKKLIGEGLSVSEVADRLCFDSANYFSKVFRKLTGLSPSEYRDTLR